VGKHKDESDTVPLSESLWPPRGDRIDTNNYNTRQNVIEILRQVQTKCRGSTDEKIRFSCRNWGRIHGRKGEMVPGGQINRMPIGGSLKAWAKYGGVKLVYLENVD
jgi:hypothetical protein